jgi:hypothetical protein
MSQRVSGYARRPDDDYPTPAWVVEAIAAHLRRRALDLWEPAVGKGALAAALTLAGFRTCATSDDFLRYAAPPRPVDAIVSNPPYGVGGRLAAAFVRHALGLDVPVVAMLLRVDFDSGKTRSDLFRDNPSFATKLVLLDRIKWFDGPSAPSDNHAWFIWDRRHEGAPSIAYFGKGIAMTLRSPISPAGSVGVLGGRFRMSGARKTAVISPLQTKNVER